MPESTGDISSIEILRGKEGKLCLRFSVFCGNCNSVNLNVEQEVVSPQGNIIYECPCGRKYNRSYELRAKLGKTRDYFPIREICDLARHLFPRKK